MNRPVDPRADRLCTGCNWVIGTQGLRTRPHCTSPTCPWWTCPRCGAHNDKTGANNRTYRDGTPRA